MFSCVQGQQAGRFFILKMQRLGRNHFGDGQRRAMLPADLAERAVGHPGHGCKEQPPSQGNICNLHGILPSPKRPRAFFAAWRLHTYPRHKFTEYILAQIPCYCKFQSGDKIKASFFDQKCRKTAKFLPQVFLASAPAGGPRGAARTTEPRGAISPSDLPANPPCARACRRKAAANRFCRSPIPRVPRPFPAPYAHSPAQKSIRKYHGHISRCIFQQNAHCRAAYTGKTRRFDHGQAYFGTEELPGCGACR